MGEPVELGATERAALPLRATWLRRAIRNLIENALRYGERARVSLVREGRHAVIRIEDDGPGIPQGDIARLMEPFSRGETSRNRETGGSGLGLTLARAIAEQHGGTVKLENRRGPGGALRHRWAPSVGADVPARRHHGALSERQYSPAPWFCGAFWFSRCIARQGLWVRGRV